MGLYRDRGIVLRTIKLGEADRIVTLVTEQHGKVRAVAKGVRKTKSRFGARVEPMTHVSMLLWEGRELDGINQAETIDHFRDVREDLDRLTRATTMLEAVDAVVQEREPDPRLYQMLLGALRRLGVTYGQGYCLGRPVALSAPVEEPDRPKSTLEVVLEGPRGEVLGLVAGC